MVSGSGWTVACGLLGFLGWVVFAVACGSGASFIAGWWWFCLTRVELLVGLVWMIAGLSYCCIVCFGLAGFWFAVDCVV